VKIDVYEGRKGRERSEHRNSLLGGLAFAVALPSSGMVGVPAPSPCHPHLSSPHKDYLDVDHDGYQVYQAPLVDVVSTSANHAT